MKQVVIVSGWTAHRWLNQMLEWNPACDALKFAVGDDVGA